MMLIDDKKQAMIRALIGGLTGAAHLAFQKPLRRLGGVAHG